MGQRKERPGPGGWVTPDDIDRLLAQNRNGTPTDAVISAQTLLPTTRPETQSPLPPPEKHSDTLTSDYYWVRRVQIPGFHTLHTALGRLVANRHDEIIIAPGQKPDVMLAKPDALAMRELAGSLVLGAHQHGQRVSKRSVEARMKEVIGTISDKPTRTAGVTGVQIALIGQIRPRLVIGIAATDPLLCHEVDMVKQTFSRQLPDREPTTHVFFDVLRVTCTVIKPDLLAAIRALILEHYPQKTEILVGKPEGCQAQHQYNDMRIRPVTLERPNPPVPD